MCYQTAGIVGVNDPGPMTLRELDWMAKGAEKAHWTRTADLMALIANVNRSEGTSPFRSDEFNRMVPRKAKKAKPGSINALRVFLPKHLQDELRKADGDVGEEWSSESGEGVR